jgi:hypothetical protein
MDMKILSEATLRLHPSFELIVARRDSGVKMVYCAMAVSTAPAKSNTMSL